MVVDVTKGCSFTFPPRLAQGLESATDEQLAQVEILGSGYGLHWKALDVAAARANGAKGGRPGKSAPG
ncbi:DUF2442 domain-containing protein [Lichenicoccus sp.]|uniref:DUF2442 domain-containing protein n=1 Tax=Lichenicoccus sp. TaxID=2781899 RepID=UPI003D116B0D